QLSLSAAADVTKSAGSAKPKSPNRAARRPMPPPAEFTTFCFPDILASSADVLEASRHPPTPRFERWRYRSYRNFLQNGGAAAPLPPSTVACRFAKAQSTLPIGPLWESDVSLGERSEPSSPPAKADPRHCADPTRHRATTSTPASTIDQPLQ